MNELLQLTNLSYEMNDLVVLEDVNAKVHRGDIIGIIGKNGAGKSTLLQLLSNGLVPTKGNIQRRIPNLKIVMVEQETETYSSEAPSPAEAKLLELWKVPTNEFSYLSGGEKRKLRLAKGLSQEADLLLLDEPTNHLDEQSIQSVKKQIEKYQGTIILVSHDRFFLDEVAKKIWSIEGRKLIEHKGNYSSYMEVRKQKRISQQRAYEKQQKMVERIEDQIKELSTWSQKAHMASTKKEGFKEYYRVKAKRTDSQVKSKQKRLEKELEKSKVERVEEEYSVRFSLSLPHKTGKRLLEVKNITKSFNGRALFRNVDFTIQHGEKISIIGPNGSGKTTLLKILVGHEPADGDIWVSPPAKIGYLSQEVFDLPLEQTPEQLFFQETFKARGKVQTLMKHLGFMASQWTEPIEKMSMGERVKCKLMKYILEEKDILILDEPTNHLDLPSREQLEETLAQYPGTLIVVSHDRYFREKTTSIKLVIENQQIQKQWNEQALKSNNDEELWLKLEWERQEVLGKLSFIRQNDKAYGELDDRFNELTKQINELKKNF